MAEMKRVNARISNDVNQWLDEESARSGVTKSTLIYLALEQYMNQKRNMAAMTDISKMLEKMSEMEEKLNASEK